MKIYLITQDLVHGYDTYDSAVVSAESEEDAKNIHPSECVTHIKDGMWMGTFTKGGEYEYTSRNWVSASNLDQVKVQYIGESKRGRGLILSSFNAG
ncbi:hypothetical protein [Lewinella sp. W8]|uniref:hypothetical protein n=1 Tax=Lewinella sp. W8 TaxID=2528208 RepID=UPI0010676340|nr:hypothetical protein [Lewinella sp. W8]MTB53061.1 hypothetical protein [Lewinella sp. W8]